MTSRYKYLGPIYQLYTTTEHSSRTGHIWQLLPVPRAQCGLAVGLVVTSARSGIAGRSHGCDSGV
jgi:hypothetical protein